MTEHRLTEEQVTNMKQLRESGDTLIYNLGLNALQKYDLFTEWTRVNNAQNLFQQEILEKYGEGELKFSEGIFVTKV